MLFSLKDEGLSPNEALLPEGCQSVEKELAIRIVSSWMEERSQPVGNSVGSRIDSASV